MKDAIKLFLSDTVIVPIVIIAAAILLYLIVRKLIHKLMLLKIRGVRADNRRQKTMVGLIDNLAKYFIAMIALLMLLDHFGVDTKSLLASLGVLTLVAGLALQDLLKDVVAGFVIVFEDQYAIGDVVQIGDFKGTITHLGIKSTRMKSITGETLIIANRNVDRVINYALENCVCFLDVDVAYSSELDKVKAVLTKVCMDLTKELNLTKEATVCGVEKFGASGITVRISFETIIQNKLNYERIFRLKIKKAFDKNNIEIPFTQVVIHNADDKVMHNGE